MTVPDGLGGAEMWGVIVTYRRPQVLRQMLDALEAQSRRPDHLIIVDNDGDSRVRLIAEQSRAIYVDAGDNLGPAGGIALAMKRILEHAAPQDWILCLDDDDPPWRTDQLAIMWEFAHQQLHLDPATGGVGGAGGPYRRSWGIFRRLEDSELVGAVPVNVLAGGRFPLYRCEAVQSVGTFDPTLFWGFEEGEYGLHLGSKGYHLYIHGGMALDLRRISGDLHRPSSTVHSARDKAAWRRYYGVRNAVTLARRYGAFWTPPLVALGGAFKGVVGLARLRRPLREVCLPAQGAWDGLRGRLGRTVDPGSNAKVDR